MTTWIGIRLSIACLFAAEAAGVGASPSSAGGRGRRHRASILRARFQYHLEKPVTLEKLSGSLGVESLVH